MSMGTARIIHGDSRDLPLDDASVDLVITSPPYYALRSYQDGGEHYDGQIGAEQTPDEFVGSLLEVVRECVRVLKPTGSLWVNLGDKYAGSDGTPGGSASSSLMGQERAHLAASGRKPLTDIRTKSLIGIPWRFALRCIDELGLILRAEVIWSKPNGVPESVMDRARRTHEQWFHFTVQQRYYAAVDDIREPHNDLSWLGRDKQERTNSARNDGGKMCNTANHLGKVPGSVWTIPSDGLRVPPELGVDHFAAFPIELPRRIIMGWSPVGVCTACGEGRRPITERGPEYAAYRAATGDFNAEARSVDGYDAERGKQRVATARVPTDIRHAGYVCACTPYHDVAGVPVERTDDRETGLGKRTTRGNLGAAPTSGARRVYHLQEWTPAPTRPAVVLDPFGGTGTTALVAKALGREGISVDMSRDYCRLAEWRTNDEGELARAMRVPRPARQIEGQQSLLDMLGGDSA